MISKKWRVLVSSPEIQEAGLEVLREKCELVIVPLLRATKESVLERVVGVDAILCCNIAVDADIINAAGPSLKVVSTLTNGVDHLDVRLLKERGVLVGNAPGVQAAAVADIGVALVLAVSRRLQEGRQIIDRGLWEEAWRPQFLLGRSIAGDTVGVVGLGAIGQAFARRIKAFGTGRLLYTGRKPKPEAAALGAEFVSFDELVETSDVILIACPWTPETDKLFNAAVFKKMKTTSILINVGRGKIIDLEALAEALKTKTIWGAGLDVMYPEPLPTNHPLLQIENCVLYPHVGCETVETRSVIAALAAKNILCGLEGKPLPAPV